MRKTTTAADYGSPEASMFSRVPPKVGYDGARERNCETMSSRIVGYAAYQARRRGHAYHPVRGVSRAIKLLVAAAAFVVGCGICGASEDGTMIPERKGKGIGVRLLCEQSEATDSIVELLRHCIEQRCAARLQALGQAGLVIELALQPTLGTDAFRVEDGSGGVVRIVGGDTRGLLYGVGRFLRTSRYNQVGITAGMWRGTSVPALPVRGMYFATHFHNFYHEAPMAKVQQYVGELALWGMNTLIVWYDMHHFSGWDDPAAVAIRTRLRSILQCARRLGLDVGFVVVANEGYANSPMHLRADPSGARGARFPGDICISKPEGQKYVLDNFSQLFDWARDLHPGFVWLWPYDSGGCACNECRPWGSNGFLRASKRTAQLAKQILPGAKIALATWYFDQAEWKDLARIFSSKPDWTDYLISQPGTYAFSNSSPGGLPILGFPEISMKGMRPWGGFGANPQPRALREYWTGFKAKSRGGFPYSEGIFEDLNKIICTQLYWNPDRPVDDIVTEYISFEFSPDVVEETMEMIRTLEQNHHLRPWPYPRQTANANPKDITAPPTDPGAEEAYATAKRVNARLSPTVQKSWRWRILFLRALLDSELKNNDGKANDVCTQAFRELTEIYHAQGADRSVKPPAPPSP